VSTTVTSTTRSRVHGLEGQLSSLGKATESLLRTARLDTALLASGEDELRATVAELEERWRKLEQMVEELEEERGVEQQEDGMAGASDSESAGPSRTDQGSRPSDAARRLSSIDWDSERPSFKSNLSDASVASCSTKDEEEAAKDGNPWWRFGNNKKEFEQIEQLQADTTADSQTQGRRRSSNSVGSAFAKLFSPKGPPDVDQSSSEPSKDKKRTSELEETAALRLKLKTRDSAAESLHQLVTMQSRSLIDLRYQRNLLEVKSKYIAIHQQSELDELRQKLRYLKIEKRRKEMSIQESEVRLEKLSRHKEMLGEELQIVKAELVLLDSKMSNLVDGRGDYMSGDDIGVQDKVMIA